jgi:hypothetical protein
MATATTLDHFEARTHDALAGVLRVRRQLRRARARARLLAFEIVTGFALRRLMAALNHRGWIAQLSADEARTLALTLTRLYGVLGQALQLGEERELARRRMHRHFFKEVTQARDRIGDVLETLHLSLNDDFQTLVDSCSKEILGRQGRRDWRSSLAAMRD